MPLTDLDCRNAKPRDRDYKLADGQGLYLLVRPGGARLWRLKYRHGGRERALSFGPYPEVSLRQARDRRLATRQALAAGRDPGRTPSADRMTFEAAARRWHEGRRHTLDPAHEQRVLARFERDVFPEIGQRPVDEIEAAEILTMIRRVEARGALDISRRLRQGCGQVFRYAIANGWARRDPAADLRGALKPKPRVRHMARLAEADLPEFLSRLARYDGERLTALAIRFTLLTWARTSEVRFAVWPEFEGLDGADPLWRIPARRMKMHREHLVPLSRQAVAVLRELREMNRGEYLFPGTGRRQVMSQNTMIYGLYRLGYHSRATIHGFRGTASTIANESELWHRDAVELQLAHADDDEVRSAYNAALHLATRRRMMQWWGDLIEGKEDPLAGVLG